MDIAAFIISIVCIFWLLASFAAAGNTIKRLSKTEEDILTIKNYLVNLNSISNSIEAINKARRERQRDDDDDDGNMKIDKDGNITYG
jgi:hypothetical protein